MPIKLAGPLGNHPGMNGSPRYKAPTPQMAPQEKSAASQMTDMMTNKAMSETVDYGATKLNENVIQPGLEKASAMFSPAAAAPSTTQMTAMTGKAAQGLSPGAAQAIMGSGSSAAPLVAEASGMAGAELAKMGGAELAKQATTNAVASGAATGGMGAGMAALGTAVPYIGAAMLAGKAFGLFSNGGHVGPLHASGGSKVRIVRPYRLSDKGQVLKSRESKDYYSDNPKPLEIDNMGFGESFDYDDPDSDYYSKGGAVHANMGGLMPMLMDKAKEEGIPMGLASMLSAGSAGPVSQAQYKSAGGPTRGARVDSTGQPFNAASMFKEISNMPNENALIQEVMDKYNVNAYEAAVMIAESQGNQMNQDFLSNTVMEEIFDGPGGHGLTAKKILNSAPNYVKEKHSNYVGPISQIQYKSAGGEAYTVKYGGPLSAK